MEPLILGLP
jgi:hypothetical protein